MTQIILTPEQARVYHMAKEPIQVCDAQGKVIGTLPPDYSSEFIAELKRRAREPGRRYTSEQVTQYLKKLAEVRENEGPIDRERAIAILKELHGEDA
ncbi:MAG TPA: hypothetical protein VFE62_02175 [Gemmataceae bacterium]|nr:hypothetical protein [Gemmataceae bacterium]